MHMTGWVCWGGGVTCCPGLARFPDPFEVTQECPRVPLAPSTTYLSRAPPSRGPTPSPAPGLAPRQPRVQPPERANIFPLLLFPLECLERAGFHLSITEKKRRSLKKKKKKSRQLVLSVPLQDTVPRTAVHTGAQRGQGPPPSSSHFS